MSNLPPRPQGFYKPASRSGNIIFTAGMTPRSNGDLVAVGKISTEDDLEIHRHAVTLATANAIAAAGTVKSAREEFSLFPNLVVYLNTEPTFDAHSKVADFASDYLALHFGHAAIGARSSVGVCSLPGNATVEVHLVAEVTRRS